MDKVLKVFGEGINDFYSDICTEPWPKGAHKARKNHSAWGIRIARQGSLWVRSWSCSLKAFKGQTAFFTEFRLCSTRLLAEA